MYLSLIGLIKKFRFQVPDFKIVGEANDKNIAYGVSRGLTNPNETKPVKQAIET